MPPTKCPRCGFADGLTVSEAATRMGVTEQTIRNWIEKGRLPNATREVVPGGFRWWIPAGDLEAAAA